MVVLGWSAFLASYGLAIQYYTVPDLLIIELGEKSVGHGISPMKG